MEEINFIRPQEVFNRNTGESKVRYTSYDGSNKFIPVVDGEDGVPRTLVVTTHAELKAMRDAGKLTPGALYRITDYQCTTTQANTRSAGHQFDIVLLALSNNKLAEEGWAMMHENDTYFANSNLSAWKIWYCLDNDTSRFAWADATNGKGVIYRMIDEWGNDCPYDFKNIQFKRWKVTAANDELFVYSDENPHYFGIYDSNNDEIVAPYGINAEIEDIDDWRWCYTFDGYNIDKSEQYDFSTHRNKATDEAIQWAIEDYNGGALQDICSGNVIECYATADVGGDCTMQKMQLGNNVFFATSYCHYEDEVWNYAFAETWGNTLGQEAYRNTLGQEANRNTLGQEAYSNTLGQGANSNTLGQGANRNTLGQGAYSNTLGPNCYDIVFGSSVNNVTVPKAYCRYIRVEVGVAYVNITTNATTSISQYLQNIIVGMGVKGTSSNRKTITHATVNDAKQTTYVPTNSTTVNV